MKELMDFEELESWQKSRILTHRIYEITNRPHFEKDWVLRDLIRRSCITIMGKIAEGFERGNTRDFIQCLLIAKSSLGELRSHLYVASDQRHLSEEEFVEICCEVQEISEVIEGLAGYLSEAISLN